MAWLGIIAYLHGYARLLNLSCLASSHHPLPGRKYYCLLFLGMFVSLNYMDCLSCLLYDLMNICAHVEKLSRSVAGVEPGSPAQQASVFSIRPLPQHEWDRSETPGSSSTWRRRTVGTKNLPFLLIIQFCCFNVKYPFFYFKPFLWRTGLSLLHHLGWYEWLLRGPFERNLSTIPFDFY